MAMESRQGKNRAEVGLLGRKLGMTQIFEADGTVVPVTVVEAGPCPVLQVKTQKSDGYNAIQIGFGSKREKNVNKPLAGHFKKAQSQALQYLRELRQSSDSVGQYTVGQEIKADIFNPGEYVDVVGTTIGKGFAGVFKRHNFHGKHSGHGSHEAFRHGGSLGMRTPQHVVKGKKMAGHMGDSRATMPNLKVVAVRPTENLILVRGAVPGKKNSLVILTKAKKPRKVAIPQKAA